MKISVVTAVLNGAASIAATMRSVRQQSHEDMEHVIIDGASTDATVDVIRSHADHHCKLLSEADSGIYDAFNKGLACADGDVICHLNSGDIYSDCSVLSRVAQLFSADDVDAVYGDVVLVDRQFNRVIRRYRSSRFRPTRLAYGLMPAHPALFLRRSVYRRFGMYDTRYRIAGDFDFAARIFRTGELRSRCIDAVLVRMRAGGISTGGLSATCVITREMKQSCDRNGISTNYLKLLLRIPIKLTEYARLD